MCCVFAVGAVTENHGDQSAALNGTKTVKSADNDQLNDILFADHVYSKENDLEAILKPFNGKIDYCANWGPLKFNFNNFLHSR